MFENTNNKYDLQELLHLDHLVWANFKFWILDCRDFDNFDTSLFENKKNIVILEGDANDLKDVEKLRSVLSYITCFTKNNFLEKFGLPEKTHYFNVIVNDSEFYISNFSSRSIQEEMYDNNKEYLADYLNFIKIIKITSSFADINDKQKLFSDIVKFICCGCSVIISDENIINLFKESEKIYLNKILDLDDCLQAEIVFKKNFGHINNVLQMQKIIDGLFY